jgi:hypothetical protein
VKGHTVWLKTLNLALIGGTPHNIFFCYFIVALKLFSYCFKSFCYCCVFKDKRVLQFKFGGMLRAMPVQIVPHLPGQLFPCIYTLGTMCNLSLGVWETHLHTLCLVLF